jgi:hypothetical protein
VAIERKYRSRKRQPPPGYLDAAGLARKFNRAERTIWRWRALRIGPPATRIGGDVYWREVAADAWLLTNEEQPA